MDKNKLSIRSLVDQMLVVIIVILAVGSFICGISAYNAAIFTDEEYRAYSDSLMERDAYLKCGQIGYEYGIFASMYYQYKYIENDHISTDELLKKREDHAVGEQITNAISNNFAVPINTKRDEEILKRYEKLQIHQASLERKMDFHNRFKDTMAWIGGMLSLFLIVFVLYKALMRLRGINKTSKEMSRL